MNADWDDAPRRGRKKPKPFGLVISTAFTLCMFTAMAYVIDSNGWLNFKHPIIQNTQPIQSDTLRRSTLSSKPSLESYDEQVQTMLRQSPTEDERQIERAIPAEREVSEQPRQTVFNDGNYIPRGDVNTITMHSSRQAPQRQQAQPNRQYINVVEASRLSCGPFKAGSSECRRYKQQTVQIHRKACDFNGRAVSCDIADRYYAK